MDSRTGLLLLFLLRCAGSAPLASHDLSALKAASQQALTLVKKIHSEVSQVHSTVVTIEGLTLNSSSSYISLQTKAESLGILPPPVLKPLSEHFSLEHSVSLMLSGVQVLQQVLQVLSERVLGLTELQTDLRDLLIHLTKMKSLTHLVQATPSPSSIGLDGDYEVQVAAHVTLAYLHSFCVDLIRSLRGVDAYDP